MRCRPGKVIKAGGSLTGLLLLCWTSALAAQPAARFALSWNGPPGCPSAENVRARVDALLDGGATAGSVADVRASGEVERVDNGYRLLLTMGVNDTPSSRVIEARSCDELAGAAAIAIALLARSSSESASESSTGEGTTGSDASATPAPPTPAPPNREPPSGQKSPPTGTSPGRLRFLIDAPVGVAGWGSLPSVGLGLGAGLGVRWRALRFAVGGELWHPQTDEVSGFASRFTLQSGRAEACLVQPVLGLELGPCLGAGVQRLAGEGVESPVFSAKSRTSVWIFGSGGLFASVPMPGFAHLRFFGVASVFVSPARPRFVIDQLGPIHQPALAAPRLDLGCEWIF
jgi:hypothetical protein